ncbi:MAG: hypothetical protein QOH09_2303, partial [Pseudonocardiales bacterium]|nr:hypothetical protein [Pseudonocardiales bacterium]
DQTRVTIEEVFDRGPARLIPAPFQAALIRPRNIESLRRLADTAEHREVVCKPGIDG